MKKKEAGWGGGRWGRPTTEHCPCIFLDVMAKTSSNPSCFHSGPTCPTGLGKIAPDRDENKWEYACVLLISWPDLSQNFLLAKASLSIYMKVTVFFLFLGPFWFTASLADPLLPGALKITPPILESSSALCQASSSWPHFLILRCFTPQLAWRRGSLWGGPHGPSLSACWGSKNIYGTRFCMVF